MLFNIIFLKKAQRIFFILLFVCCYSYTQSSRLKAIEQKVYLFNNQKKYQQSVKFLQQELQKTSNTQLDRYYLNLYLSYTYKRLFDYPSTFSFLNMALESGKKCKNPSYFVDNINCQKAYVFFDLQNYAEAKKLMDQLSKQNYRHLNTENQAKIKMQQAYLLFLDHHYEIAEHYYDQALRQLEKIGSCDLPMIYGKKIELYGAMGRVDLLNETYTRSMQCADRCQIDKYKIYTVEMAKKTFADIGDYQKAYHFNEMYDSLVSSYNPKEYREAVNNLKNDFEQKNKKKEKALQYQTLTSKNRLILILLIAFICLFLFAALYFAWLRRKKLLQEKRTTKLFTKSLLIKTEEERKRIASNLHDDINNEILLTINSIDSNPQEAKNKLIEITNHVRNISRNLHPVLFDELGLNDSVTKLAKRVQEQYRFVLNTQIDYNQELSKSDELQVYRIIQEAINNMIKYSGGIAGLVSISRERKQLIVEVRDNGKGFAVKETLQSDQAFGLHNIAERAQAINGKFELTSDHRGTRVKILIPFTKKHHRT